MTRLWDKQEPLDQRILKFTVGDDPILDSRLVAYDVRASIAHTEMLCAKGYLTTEDKDAIAAGLKELGAAFERGEWTISLDDEDCHTALESRLIKSIGTAGERVHLGRSRNDQVLTAMRMYLRDAVDDIVQGVAALDDTVETLIERDGGIAIPGYTHMQPAMPSTVALWAEGYREGLQDAKSGLAAARARLNVNPLGTAAGYGTPGLDLDREATTAALEFNAIQEPVTAAQLSRGRAESALVFELNLLLIGLGRMASDLLLFYTQEFGIIELSTDTTTGSSIMPQKRNPDVLELIRAASATVQGCLAECMTLVTKLPSGYQRDLQRLKSPVFRAIDVAGATLDAATTVIAKLRFDADAVNLDPSLYAAEEAYALVQQQGLTFREAYRQISKKFT
ncbi:MAG: argininosuccinate lyase [Pseudomonadota bacterium]